MKKVFISYSSAEYDYASKYRQAFTNKGIQCWMAPESIPVGSNYAIEIPKAIQDADVFVLILSESSQNSKWVRKEIDLAVNLNKAIFPVRISNGQLISPFSFYLADVQMTQVTDDAEIIAERLLAILDPRNAKTGFEAVPVSDNASNEQTTHISAPSPNVEPTSKTANEDSSNKIPGFVKSHKIPLIAACAVAAIGIGVGIGVTLTSGGNASATESSSISNTENANSTEDTTDININDIKEVTDLEYSMSLNANEYTGIYTGEAAEGKIPHGTGKFHYTDNDAVAHTYEGAFSNGKPEGEITCVSTYPDGHEFKKSTCTASFTNGLAEGKYTTQYVYKDGSSRVDEGYFIDGQENGKRLVKTNHVNGDVVEGEYDVVDGKVNGKGKKTTNSANGDVLIIEGDVIDGQFHGQAKLEVVSVADGYTMTYEGEYSNNKWHGYGVQTTYFTSGGKNVYEGNYTNGYKNGKGKRTYTSGNGNVTVYEGTWTNGKLSGKGTETKTYADGTSDYISCYYEGEFKDDKCNGFGKQTITYIEDDDRITSVYEGEWKDGKQHGKGTDTITYRNGESTVYECSYVNGEKTGFGTRTTTYPEGGKLKSYFYEGEWSENKANGKGKQIYEYTNGETLVYECNYVDGRITGFGTQTITYPEGHERKSYYYEGEWTLDKRNGQGKLTITYSNGNVEIQEGQWKDGNFIG